MYDHAEAESWHKREIGETLIVTAVRLAGRIENTLPILLLVLLTSVDV